LGNLLDNIWEIIAAIFVGIVVSCFIWGALTFAGNLLLRWLLIIVIGIGGLYGIFRLLRKLFLGKPDEDE
jgi:hypothetical protein